MTKPVLNFGPFTVCFEAEEETISARYHFVNECGWTDKEFRQIKDYPFFCAKVSIWRDGVELASDYLGACSYKTEKDFYTRYRSDYFADMVGACVDEINNSELTALYAPWAEKMRKDREKSSEKARIAWEKKQAKKSGATIKG